MARRPLTIAIAPFSRAKSTTRLLKGSARTFSRWPTADSTKEQRSSASKTVFPLRIGRLTTPTITSSYIFAARVMTSMWPRVIGSYEPGTTAIRLSGAMDSDHGVAVAALVEQRERKAEGRLPAGLDRDPRARREHRGKVPVEVSRQRGRAPVWRIEEHEIVFAPGLSCAAQEAAGVGAAHLGGL